MKRFAALLLILSLASCARDSGEAPLVAIQIQDRNGVMETISSPDRLNNFGGTDFLSSQPYKKILRVYRKDGKSNSKITTYHPNGALWQYLEAKEMRAKGAYREWHPNGQLRIDTHVIGGTPDIAQGAQQDWLFDGVSKVWDEQGRLLAEISYSQGSLEGLSQYYYPSGQKEKEVPFQQNVIHGELNEYYSSGKLKAKTNFHLGKRNGVSLGFFENGQANWIEEFAEDLIVKGVYYDPKGILVTEVENGMGEKAIFEKDALSTVIEIRQGYAEGEVQRFSPTGDIISLHRIKNGKKHGEETAYFLPSERTDGEEGDPLPKMSISWDFDKIHGAVKTWYSNGQIQSQREYSHNQKAGASLAWYKDGSLMMIEEYDGGRLSKGQYYKKNAKEPTSTIVNGSGIATQYDENGIFLRKITYAKGEPLDPEN